MTRISVVLFAIVAAACLGGCATRPSADRWQPGPRTEVHYSVFEVASDDASTAVAKESRRRVAESTYDVAVVASAAFEQLKRVTLADSGTLADGDVTVGAWPRGIATGWSYSRADDDVLGAGNGTGYLGVRAERQSRQLRIAFEITHTLNRARTVDPAARIEAPIFYEGTMEPDHVVVFLAPFTRTDGRQVTHVIAFRAGTAG